MTTIGKLLKTMDEKLKDKTLSKLDHERIRIAIEEIVMILIDRGESVDFHMGE